MNLQTSEDICIERAVKGDQTAFISIYGRYVDRVYKHVYYRIYNRTDAEDITQEVFIKAWKGIKKYKPTGAPFLAWLLAIARNAVTDHYRTRKTNVSLEEMELSREVVLTSAEIPESQAEDNLDQSRIRNAITKLKGNKQKVISMRFIDGFSYQEIARALRKSEGAVRVIQYRALRDLRHSLQERE